ncbi:type II toxin-antitoxin system RelE/ParE family toxin [Acinetobacter sp.]|uniref:type II toxin-antitoxin system RelE/ParE family toxin n=1 Tax=Acinetobacter sp. TaxID=472 RepID=UPI002FDAB234
MKIEWTETAGQDRRNIYDYLDERNPIAAIEIDDLIEEKIDLLIGNMLIGRSGREKGTRELVIHPHYVVVYDIKDTVRILRVLHTSQQWGNL